MVMMVIREHPYNAEQSLSPQCRQPTTTTITKHSPVSFRLVIFSRVTVRRPMVTAWFVGLVACASDSVVFVVSCLSVYDHTHHAGGRKVGSLSQQRDLAYPVCVGEAFDTMGVVVRRSRRGQERSKRIASDSTSFHLPHDLRFVIFGSQFITTTYIHTYIHNITFIVLLLLLLPRLFNLPFLKVLLVSTRRTTLPRRDNPCH